MSQHLFIVFYKEKILHQNVGSAVPSMTTEILNNMSLDIPSNKVLEKFERAVAPLYSKIKLNNNQIGTLTALSDTLLPRFMSGKMEIKG